MLKYILCLEVVGASVFSGVSYSLTNALLILGGCLGLLFFWWDKTIRKTAWPLPVSLTIPLLLFVAYLIAHLLIHPGYFQIPRQPQYQKLLDSLGVSLQIPALLSPYHTKVALYLWIIPLAAFITVPYLLTCRKDIYLLIGCIVGIATWQGIYGIFQYLLPHDPLPFFDHPDKEGRVGGTYICRNTFACFLAMAVPLCLGCVLDILHRSPMKNFPVARMMNHPHIRWILSLTVALLLMTVAIFLSLSRGGAVCWLIGVVFCFWGYSLQERSWLVARWLWVVLLLVLSSYIGLIGAEPLLDRFANLENNPGQLGGRWELWQVAWQIWQNHPWFGTGGNGYFFSHAFYMPSRVTNTHNDYLQFLVEYGTIGFILLGSFLLAWCYIIAKPTEVRSSLRGLYWGCLAALLVVFVHALGDFSLQISGIKLVASILMGILLVLIKNPLQISQISRKKERPV